MNFLIGWEKQFVVIVCVLGVIKKVCVQVNKVLGKLDVKIVDVVIQVVGEVFEGKFDDNFLLVVWQIGFGI